MTRSGSFRSLTLIIIFAVIAGVFIIALLVPAVLPIGLGGGGNQLGTADGYVEGVGVAAEVTENRNHFDPNLTITDIVPEGYLTIPPTSGRHWDGWVSCGFYADPVPDERIVHNMEHGNIIVSHNLTDPDEIAELSEVFDDISLAESWGVARPYDQIAEGTVVLTTWGVIDGPMEGVDKDRIERFFRTYSGKMGPEFPNGAPCTSGGVMSP